MRWLARLGWGALILANVVVAAAAYWVTLPEPQQTIVVESATYVANDGGGQKVHGEQVRLPHRSGWGGDGSEAARYQTHFELPTVPDMPLFLFIPAVNQIPLLTLNGTQLTHGWHHLWSGPLSSSAVFVELPRRFLVPGRNDLSVSINSGEMAISGLLSRLYVGSEEELSPAVKLRIFLQERLRTMALGAHALLSIGILFCYFRRPADPLFAWLAAMIVCGSVASIGLFAGFLPALATVRPYLLALLPSVGLLFVGVALALTGTQPARWLRILIGLVAIALVVCIATGMAPGQHAMGSFYVATVVMCLVVATGIVAVRAFRHANVEARLMLSPFFLTTWFMIRDAGVSNGLIDGSVLLSPYMRPLLLGTVLALLMHRLVATLDRLDSANETLNSRLAEREAVLALLHREERIEAARSAREQERRRLTSDLHDGISGHLVSIIAMAEQPGGTESIEQAARQALDDLRLVIYSLDLDDRELPLALANFRERLIPQLRRSGVDLVWSMTGLPEVSGVTPGNALAVLRILQEAVTNALKHGPARTIAIKGALIEGKVAIAVENDGAAYVEGRPGFGLVNMRRRAAQLDGEVRIVPCAQGTRLTLLLPLVLPDVGDAVAA